MFLPPLSKAPALEGTRRLMDIHNHISVSTRIERLVDLATYGILGVTEHPVLKKTVLDFDSFYARLIKQARNSDLEVSLVDTDVARVVNGDKEGYIVRTQEVFSGVFHAVVIGYEESIENGKPPQELLELAESQGGGVILAHPYLVNTKEWPHNGFLGELNRKRYSKGNTAENLGTLAAGAIAIEGHNAQLISLQIFNQYARAMAREYQKPIISVSDSHPMQNAEFLTGVYTDVPDNGPTMDYIISTLKHGKFSPGPSNYIPWSRFWATTLINLGNSFVHKS